MDLLRNRSAIALVVTGALLVVGCGQTDAPTSSDSYSPYAAAKRAVKGIKSIFGGNDVVAGTHGDSWKNFSLVDKSNPFPADAKVGYWEVDVRTNEPVALVIYRATSDPATFTIVGPSEQMHPPYSGFNRFFLDEPIPVKAGDYVGLVNNNTSNSRPAVYPKTLSEGSVQWSAGPGTGLTGHLPDGPARHRQPDRVYSVKAHEGVLICHKPGTPAEKMMVVDVDSVADHLGHGDALGVYVPDGSGGGL